MSISDEQLLRFNIIRLHDAVAAVAPIDHVSGEEGSVVVDYKPEATAQEIIDGDAVVAGFDWSLAAAKAWYEGLNPDRKNLRDKAIEAHNTLQTIRDNQDTLTQNQMRQAIGKISEYLQHVIKRLVEID